MEVLSVQQMYAADAAAMAGGVVGPDLMEAAGWAVTREIRRRFKPCRVAILCGPGNNGGDGFVVARLLARRGWPVRLALLGDTSRLKGDAAVHAGRWRGDVLPAAPDVLDGCAVVVDALFGAGLARPLDGMAQRLVEEIIRRRLPCVAVDVPSGVDGDSGAALGCAPQAVATVTFFRKKPGHLLLPGRALCGEVVVADIGIPATVLDAIAPTVHENAPRLWSIPRPEALSHKYARGHAVVVGGAGMTGAARLAARAARRIGAGLVTVSVPATALDLAAADSPGHLVAALETFDALLSDHRRNAWLIGPGCGRGPETAERALAALRAGRACVLDADALTSLAERPGELFAAGGGRCLLTPHDGEFARLFPSMTGSRLERARAAAAASGCVVLLKGSDTVIAAPDGRAVINGNAPPDLATAGSGDVLAGIAVGLLAQGMAVFDAACAAAWVHGAAAIVAGRGLIAEDISECLPEVLDRWTTEAPACSIA